MKSGPPENCSVCGEQLDPQQNAICTSCGGVFHLTWDTRFPIKDCGRFDIDEDSLALYFTCNDCLARMPQAHATTPQ